ncbi:zinc ABC transporter substrate-binding protein, partial [Candidatus Sumerlaeota bacterium]|nr:zinc ABC transporter substrate-binding protein [Candidatus Sumerlaeota bacterium]
MKRYLKFINVWWSLGVVCLLVACSPNRPQENKKIVALASVFPLVDWVKQVGDDKVEVIYLPAPDTPHQNFSLSPELRQRISQTDIVFEINRGLDDWLNPILHTHATKKPSIVVLSKRMPALEPYGTQHHIDYDQTLASHQASSLNIDPHIWLDPILAQQMVLHIADALSTINPSADKYFHANAERYMKQLTELHFWIDRKLAGLSQRRLFVVHSSFTYFAYRYNLTLVPLDNILPQQKPAPEC